MTYDAFLEQMKKDLESDFSTELSAKYSGEQIGIRDVEKVQGESYRGISFKNGDSPVEGNLNMQNAFHLYEHGRPYKDIQQETEQAIMRQVDRMPQFDLGAMGDYQAMKPKLMTELIPQKGNEEKRADVPHEKIEDLALIYSLDLGESSNGRMTSIVTNQVMEQCGIMQEQLHQDAVENAEITHLASLRSMPKFDPDADILNLIYTIPSWISSIDRAAKYTDFQKITAKSNHKLANRIVYLREALERINQKLMEVE